MLFMNKLDLFTEKLKHVDLALTFPEFEGNLFFPLKIAENFQ